MLSSSFQPAPKRVLHLVHWLNRGGIETWLLAMMRQASRESLEMDVCCKGPQSGELAEDFCRAGARLHHLPQRGVPLRFVWALRNLLIRERYDALHVHTGVHSGLGVLAARLAGVPVVTTFHNTQFPRESAWSSRFLVGGAIKKYASQSLRYAVLKSEVSTGVSQGVCDVVQRVSGLEAPVCKVSYLGVADSTPLSQKEIGQKRRELNIAPEEKMILHVGSLTEQKNHLGLLEVYRRICNQLPEAKLLIVGEGGGRGAIERRIAELGLDSGVRMLGLRSDVGALMQASDLFLFPSIREGLSLTLMEASAARLPIVASSIPGNVEATAGGTSARLHDVNDSVAMAESACQLLRQPALATRLTDKAREIYDGNFSLEVTSDWWQQLYERVIEQASGGLDLSECGLPAGKAA